MTRWLVLAALLAGCAHETPPPVEPRDVAFPARSPVPAVINEAAKVQKDAAHVAKTRDGLSSAELLRMIELSHRTQNAVARVKAHRTAANVAAVRSSTRALREFTRRAP